MNMGILTGIQVPITRLISNNIFTKDNTVSNLSSSLCGGIISGLFCSPMELVVIQQQNTGANIYNTMKYIINKHGYKRLFRGLSTSCGREGLFTTGYLGLTPVLSNYFITNHQTTNYKAKIYSSLCSGFITSTMSHPIDTIKTCLQGDIDSVKYKNSFNTIIKLYKENGIKRFFRGWVWRTSRFMFSFFILNESIIQITKIIY